MGRKTRQGLGPAQGGNFRMTTYYEQKSSGKRYTVVSADAEKNTIRLKGEHAEFDEPNDDVHFQRMGYVRREGDPASDARLDGSSVSTPATPSAPPAAPSTSSAPAAPPVAPPAPPAAPGVPSVPAVPNVPGVPPAPPTIPAAPAVPAVPGGAPIAPPAPPSIPPVPPVS